MMKKRVATRRSREECRMLAPLEIREKKMKGRLLQEAQVKKWATRAQEDCVVL